MKLSRISATNPITFLWARFLLAYISALIIAKIKNIELSYDKRVITLSLIHPMAAFYLQILSSRLSEVTAISVITATSPAVISLMGQLSGKEKLSEKSFIYIALCVAGGITASSSHGISGLFSAGSALMLFSVILRGVYYVKSGNITKEISPASLSFSQITYAFIGYSILLILSGEQLTLPMEISIAGELLCIAYMGILSTTAAYFLNNYLLKNLSVSVNGAITALSFVVSLIGAAIINKETITWSIITGASIILISVILLVSEKARK
jgi:drug/metabolite transporter (DMT)-like permease